MSSSSLNRKDFLVLTVSSAVVASFLEACGGDDPATTGGTAGTGTAGTGTAGTGTAGTGTAGTGTAGTGTAGTGAGGTSAGSGGAGGGTGGAGGGTGGASAGTGGASGGTGGASGGTGGASGGTGGGGGSGGGGGGMCGSVSIMQTSAEPHDHIPDDPTMLKADLKMLINGNMSTMEFALPMDNPNNHSHKLVLTVQEVMTLKANGMITGKKSSFDNNHDHTYTIGCTA